MLDKHKKIGQKSRLLDKIVPQNASGIFQHTDKHRYLGSFVFDRRSGMTVLCVKKLAQLAKTSESPVALFGDKSMVRI
jgi:hypothetical protein